MRFFTVLAAMLLFTIGFSQDLVLIEFTDKPDAQYYFDNPSEMLTQKALDRKARHNVELDILDVPVEESYVTQVEDLGIEPIGVSKWFNGVFALCTSEQVTDAENLPFVSGVYSFVKNPGGKVSALPDKFEASTHKGNSAFGPMDYNYGYTEAQVTQLNLDFLHELGYTGDGITIAVLDNGFPGVNTRSGFSYIRDNGQIKDVYNFVSNSADIYSGGSHGTVVLSTIGGYVENEFVGTAIDADFYLYVTENNTHEMPDEEVNWILAAERSDYLGADVINTSLGYNEYDDSRYNYVYEDMDGETTYISRGAQIAAEKGIMVVVSAGNSGNSSWTFITAPADAKDVFTIGAVDSEGYPAGFSSYGPTYDGRIKPDVDAMGVYASVIDQYGQIGYSNGTSFSSPIMAGAMACLIQAFPDYYPGDLRQEVRETASLYDNPTDQMGYGIPNFEDAYGRCLGVTDFDRENYVTVYPNPADDLIFIKSEKRIKQFQLISFEGKIIRKPEVSNQIDLSGLPKGVYMLKVQFEDGRFEVKKIIKK